MWNYTYQRFVGLKWKEDLLMEVRPLEGLKCEVESKVEAFLSFLMLAWSWGNLGQELV